MSQPQFDRVSPPQATEWNPYGTPPPPPPTTTPSTNGLTPYLTLPHYLSLAWLASPVLSLIFIAFRLILSMGDAQDASNDAKNTLMASCNAAQTAAGVATNIPVFMAQSLNANIEDAVNDTIDAAKDTMIFALSALEAIVVFIVDTYRSTFLCILELAVRATLGVLIAATEEFNSFITSSLNSVRTGIQNDITSANNVIQSAVSGINKLIPSALGISLNVPQFSVPSLSALQNVTLPTTIQDGLTNLNSSLPTLDDIRQALDDLIETPFNTLKNDINASFAGMRFDSSVLPVPQAQQLSFCGDMNTGIIDDLAHDLVKTALIGCYLLIAIAVILTAGNCFIHWYNWRLLRQRADAIRQGWGWSAADGGALSERNLLSIVYSLHHSFATTFAERVAKILRLGPQKHVNLRFFLSYIFYGPALACFLIGFFGLLSVELQLIAIGPVEKHYNGLVSAQVNDFSVQIANGINANMQNQSAFYANTVNAQITSLQSGVNNGVFGWVNGTVVPLNNTIAAFYADVQDAVNTVFGNTVLASPMQEFIACILGSKIHDLEAALTFVQQNFQVQLRQVPQDVLLLSNQTMQDATRPIAAAAVGGNGEDSGGIVGTLVNRYVQSLHKERIMFLIFLGLWGLVVLMAILFIMWNSYGKHMTYVFGKRRHDRRVREITTGEGIVTPWVDNSRQAAKAAEYDKESMTEETFIGEHKETTFRNVAPPPAPRRQDSASSDETAFGSQRRKGHARKLTNENRRPLEATLVPDDPQAPDFVHRPSDEAVTKVESVSPAGSYDGGVLGRLGGLFGRKSPTRDEEDSPVSRPDLSRNYSTESFGRNSTHVERSAPPNPQLVAPQPQAVQLVPGEQRKSLDWRSMKDVSPMVSLPPMPPPMPALQPQTKHRRTPASRSSSGMSIYGQPAMMNRDSKMNQLPVHTQFLIDSQRLRMPVPKMPEPLAGQPPSQPPETPGPIDRLKEHRRTLSESRQLYPRQSFRKSLIDLNAENINNAGVGSANRKSELPWLSTSPDEIEPSPFRSSLDGGRRQSIHRKAAPPMPAPIPDSYLTVAANPFKSPVATAY